MTEEQQRLRAVYLLTGKMESGLRVRQKLTHLTGYNASPPQWAFVGTVLDMALGKAHNYYGRADAVAVRRCKESIKSWGKNTWSKQDDWDTDSVPEKYAFGLLISDLEPWDWDDPEENPPDGTF